MAASCYTCNIEFGDDEGFFECDGCTTTFHLKCAGITRKEYTAREKSNRMSLLCNDCNACDPTNLINRNMNTVLKFLYKVDLTLQPQSQSWASLETSLSNHSRKLNSIEEQMNIMQQQLQVIGSASKSHETTTADHEAPATAHVLVSAPVLPSVLPTVMVKPKRDSQSRDDMMKRVKESIVGSERLVHDTHFTRGGVFIISFLNATDTMAIQNMIRVKIGDVSLPDIKEPRVKITRISAELTKDEI